MYTVLISTLTMKQIFLPLIFSLVFFMAPVAEASIVSELEVKLAGLLAQVDETRKALIVAQQAELKLTVTNNNNACAKLNNTLGLGATDVETNGEVSVLQKVLASDPFLYPEALVTGYFGPATERAVMRFQKRSGVVSSGSAQTTGYGLVGGMTRSAFLLACTKGTGSSTTTSTTPATLQPSKTAPTLTESLSTLLPIISLDTLPASASSTALISGTAKNLSSVSVSVRSTQIVYKADNVPVKDGKWSLVTTKLANGSYQVIVEGAGGGASAVGFVVIEVPAETPSPAVVVSTKPAVSVPPASVILKVNGSDRGASIVRGASAYMSWSGLNVTSCVLASSPQSEITGTVLQNGSGQTGPLTQTTAFTFTCTAKDGAFVSHSLLVEVK